MKNNINFIFSKYIVQLLASILLINIKNAFQIMFGIFNLQVPNNFVIQSIFFLCGFIGIFNVIKSFVQLRKEMYEYELDKIEIKDVDVEKTSGLKNLQQNELSLSIYKKKN